MLKLLNALAERARRLAYAQHRYDRKTVNRGVRWERLKDADGRTAGWARRENAVTRPDCPLGWARRDTYAGGRGYVLDTPADRFVAMYRAARRPAAEPVPAFAPADMREAEAMLSGLERWAATRPRS
jgi:hypothetical protein